jgi:hypothetical protein
MNEFLIVSQISAIIGDMIVVEEGNRYYWKINGKELSVDFEEKEFIFSDRGENLSTHLALLHVANSNGFKVF